MCHDAASIDRHIDLTYYGKPVQEMTRDDLIIALFITYTMAECIAQRDRTQYETVDRLRDVYNSSGILEQIIL